MNDVVLEARRILKRFPGVTALKEVSFDLRKGEVHALCGENGAGKSTLIKLLSGVHPFGTYEGDLFVDGEEVRFQSLADAAAMGIAVIHQELALFSEMTVAENIFLGCEPRKPSGLIDWRRVYSEAHNLFQRFGLTLEATSLIKDLGVGQKQLVEILKALSKRSRILILDEPTAALSESEAGVLLSIILDLKRSGISCVYISHKLEEVLAVSDRITVIRDGTSVATVSAKETSKASLIKHMVGREISDLYPPRNPVLGEVALEIRDLSISDPLTQRLRLKKISFQVRTGEVLGIGGLMGAGRSELLMHLFGAWGRRVSGQVFLNGVCVEDQSPNSSIKSGLVLVSEDRRRYGLVLAESVSFNLSLSALFKVTHNFIISRSRELKENTLHFDSLKVKAASMATAVEKLSGGNQQKVVIGRALMTDPRVVFLDEPTRGIDLGAREEIYGIINSLTQLGKAVVLVSSELSELIGMSDRIIMLSEGEVAGHFQQREATPERLLQAAMGQNPKTPH